MFIYSPAVSGVRAGVAGLAKKDISKVSLSG